MTTLPEEAVKADTLKLIERMAFGYEVMFEKLCHISGTSGADQHWYRAKAREATERLSPLHSITTESNKSIPGDCKRQYQDFMSRILSVLEPSAARELALYEGDDICARLKGLASWLDSSQHSKWCGRKEVPIHGYSGEGKLVRAAIAAIRALSSPDHIADAGKLVEGDGWSMSPPDFRRHPYYVVSINDKWHLKLHHGNGVLRTVSVHDTAKEARDAAPASEGAE